MNVPHLERPICEPVELRPGARIRVERVRQGAEAGASEPFPHYHDVHELVLFGKVAGDFVAEGRRYALAGGSIAFVPSMRQHDYALAPGPRDWLLVQIDATAGETLAQAPGLERLAHAFCARPGRALQRRIAVLADWLTELGGADPLAATLVELLLRAAVRAPAIAGHKLTADADALDRLRPAIERLRRDPAHAPSAEAAAALCALAPAYFSRRFKQQIGMTWSDYVRTHRLHLASQRLLDSEQTVAAIAYALGFSTPSHFGELFHRRFGMTPKEYRDAGRVPPQSA
ncbi:AraC family transcriptional regulator [Luteimonas sp. SX5]|uniref:AraC family transcriptional regulator n=1 Tax=Luteimonas galliterrae TaxID=2940486 RepID=A0ABT0MN86_9GAMM|nr:AraC family transcriptional regulator [Luteimonas galliterrae]MCL1635719.1 AraC family transcriptional regulator [Luteimonas galliterrae]